MFKKAPEGRGLSVVIPPRYIISLVDDLLAYHHLDYKVRVITRELNSNSNSNTLRKPPYFLWICQRSIRWR